MHQHGKALRAARGALPVHGRRDVQTGTTGHRIGELVGNRLAGFQIDAAGGECGVLVHGVLLAAAPCAAVDHAWSWWWCACPVSGSASPACAAQRSQLTQPESPDT